MELFAIIPILLAIAGMQIWSITDTVSKENTIQDKISVIIGCIVGYGVFFIQGPIGTTLTYTFATEGNPSSVSFILPVLSGGLTMFLIRIIPTARIKRFFKRRAKK